MILLTDVGYRNLVQKLERLEAGDYHEAQEEVKYHYHQGNLSENIGYIQALQRVETIEKLIIDLKQKILTSKIIDKNQYKGKTIQFGCTVTLLKDSTENVVYTLLGAEESDIKEGKISVESLLGKALIGKSVGDTIIIEPPRGETTYTVVSLLYK